MGQLRLGAAMVTPVILPDVDQTYNPTSTNPQSGVAIAGANFAKKTTWVSSGNAFYTNSSLENNDNPSTYTLNLSSYLPNDGAQYEVMCRFNVNGSCNAIVYTDSMADASQIYFVSSGFKSGQLILPVGSGRSISFSVYTGLTNFGFWASGYRKIG